MFMAYNHFLCHNNFENTISRKILQLLVNSIARKTSSIQYTVQNVGQFPAHKEKE